MLEMQHQNDQGYISLFTNNHAVMLLIDPDTAAIVDANPAASGFYGYARETLIGMKISDINILSTEEVHQEMQRAHQEQRNQFFFRHRLASGAVRDVEVYSGPITLNGKSLLYSIIHDITERTQAEAALRVSEEALQKANAELEQRVAERTADLRLAQFALDQAVDSIFWVYPDGRFFYVNEAACRNLGYSHTELLTMTVWDIDIDVTREAWYHFLHNVREQNLTSLQTMQRHKSGHLIPVEITVNHLYFDGQEYICAFARDITDRKKLEEAMQAEQQRLFALLDQLPAYVCLLAPDYSIRFANHHFIENFGENQERPCYQMLFGVPSPCDDCPMHEVLSLCSPHVWEATPRNGQTYQMHVYPFTDVDGTALVLELGINITERKQAEDALRRSEAALQQMNADLEQRVMERTSELRESQTLLQGLLDNSPTLIFVNDLEGRYLLINRQGAALMGMTPEQIRGQLQADLMPPDIVAHWRKEDQQVITTGEPLVFEQLASLEDGQHTHLTVKFPIYNAEGNIYAIGGVVTDITERKRMEEELRKFYRAVEQSSASVVVTDPSGTIEYVNPGFTHATGYSFEEAQGKNPRILKSGATPLVVYEELWRTIRSGHAWQGEFYNRRKNGDYYWESVSISPVTSADGTITHFVAVKEDITERKRTEAELQQAKEAAETANRAKSVFLANMSHELRTPLNAILGFTQLLSQDRDLQPDQQEYLRIIERSGEHLLALINDVLEMSRIEAGRVSLIRQNFDLHRFIEEVVDMFRLRAQHKQIQLLLEIAPDVPWYVHADEGKLRQVLINLLSNAIKFTDEGGVALRVAAASSAQDPASHDEQQESTTSPTQLLAFEVEDTGIGIAPDEIDDIFTAFAQTHSSQQMREGAGLGLPISQHFVQMMGGTIRVSSEPGHGSLFAFMLPFQLADSASATLNSPRRRVGRLAPDQPAYRILIVEDQPDSRKLLVTLLQSLGFQVYEAPDGQQAIDSWQQHEPHLIFMDMRMPVLDGYEATRRIKATVQGQATIIVALTASAFEEDRLSVMAAGCNHFMRKPFRQEEIYDVLSKYLGAHFVYEDDHASEEAIVTSSREAFHLTTEALTGLPPDWVADMYYAASVGDLRRMEYLIDAIQPHHELLANDLRHLVRDFRFDVIIAVTESIAGPYDVQNNS